MIAINKPVINDLQEFKNITRESLLNEQCYNIVESMEPEILKYFDKHRTGYYQKNKSGFAYTVNCLRNLLKQIDYKLVSKEKDVAVIINEQKLRKKITVFDIAK